MGLGFYEGGLALTCTLHDAYRGSWPPKMVQSWLPSAWRWQDGYLFPETRGTPLDKVMATEGPIAVGTVFGNAPGGRLKHNIYGQLSLPIGKRELMFLPNKMTVGLCRKFKERKPVHIIWDGNRELPG